MSRKQQHEDTDRTGARRVDLDRGTAYRATTHDAGVGEAHRRFGGVDLPASLAGMLAALGLTVLLAGVAGAAGSVGYQRGADTDALSLGGLVTGLVVLLVAFYVGGWVAGRIARYDGTRNGVLAAAWFVLLAGAVSGLGAWLGARYNFFDDVRLPNWFSGNETTAAVVSTSVGVLVMVFAAALGGAIGSRYHRRADALIVAGSDDGTVVTDDARAELERSEIIGRHAVR